MLNRLVKEMQQLLPDLKHVLICFNTGTIVKSTFSEPVNVPDLGDDIMGIFSKLYEIALNGQLISCARRDFKYQKFEFKLEGWDIFIYPLGENCFIVLFFQLSPKGFDFSTLQTQLKKIETLLDHESSDNV